MYYVKFFTYFILLMARRESKIAETFFYCFTVHFNSLNLTCQLMHFYI